MVTVSASQLQDRGFKPHTGHNHDSSYNTMVGWYWLVPGSGLESDKYKLLQLVSQSS